MKFPRAILFASATLIAHFVNAQQCREIRGRAEEFSATARLAIWQVGINHTFFVIDQKSTDLIEGYLHYPESNNQALFAFFTICPTTPYKKGSAQVTLITRIRNPQIRRR